MDGTASTGNMKPVTIETMLNAMREIDLLPKLDQWIVVDPQGRMYHGTYEQVMPVMLAQHPLLKMPPTFGRFDKGTEVT